MYKITKTFSIDAAHQLRGLPKDHPCGRLHGHCWKFEIIIEAEELDEKMGWLIDFGRLSASLKVFDHRCWNDIPPFDHLNPTAENIAYYVVVGIKGLPEIETLIYDDQYVSIACKVWETEDNVAEYSWRMS